MASPMGVMALGSCQGTDAEVPPVGDQGDQEDKGEDEEKDGESEEQPRVKDKGEGRGTGISPGRKDKLTPIV